MSDIEWVAKDACTLPTAEQPLRVGEFDSLFADALLRVERRGQARLRLVLVGSAGLPDRARDLADREAGCCSFFTFTVEEVSATAAVDSTRVHLEVAVPLKRVEVLDALGARAWAVRTAAESAS